MGERIVNIATSWTFAKPRSCILSCIDLLIDDGSAGAGRQCCRVAEQRKHF